MIINRTSKLDCIFCHNLNIVDKISLKEKIASNRIEIDLVNKSVRLNYTKPEDIFGYATFVHIIYDADIFEEFVCL